MLLKIQRKVARKNMRNNKKMIEGLTDKIGGKMSARKQDKR